VGSIKAQLAKMEHRLKITISDDGAGIDFFKMAQSALERQVIQPELVAQYTQAGELWRIMFIPGFSTAQTDTDMKSLSGLGMGLDTVSNAIQNLGGSIVVSSELGQGTQVRMEIPLSAPSTSTINGA
jgi:two-component system chemotaxis sensor kinase CheA